MRRVGLALVLVISGSAPATSQSVYRAISVSHVQGTVSDPYGSPIADANVELKSNGERIAASKTNDKGEFSIQAPPGKYWLAANSRAFAPGEAYISLGIDLLTLVKSSHLWMILKPGVANDDCTFAVTSRRQFEKAILKRPQGI